MIIGKKNVLHPSQGETIIEMLGKSKFLGETQNISCSKVILKPETKTQEHFHRCFDEIYYVIKGEGLLIINSISFPYKQGDCVLVQKMEKHYLVNDNSESELLVVCVPGWDENDCVKL